MKIPFLEKLAESFGNPIRKKNEPRSRFQPDSIRVSPIENSYNWSSWIWKQIIDKPIEVVALGLVGLGIGFSTSYLNELKREVAIPLAFSEISQLESKAAASGVEIGKLNHYHAALNDSVMKVFECWNEAYTSSGRDMVKFRDNLKSELSDNSKHKYNLNSFVSNENDDPSSVYLPNLASKALQEAKELKLIISSVPDIAQKFSSTWSDSHHNHYHTETYYDDESYTDSNGKRHTRSVMKTRQVYDYTDHSYTYYSENGESASRSIDELVNNIPNIQLNERLAPAIKVQEDNRTAILNSRKARNSKVKIDDNEYLRLAANWADGATYTENIENIHSTYNALVSGANNWRSEKNDAHSTSYRTYSCSDPGPKEFRTCEGIVRNSSKIVKDSQKVVDGISYVLINTHSLDNKIRTLVSMSEDQLRDKTGEKNAQEIIDSTMKMYSLNFSRGFDVSQSRPLVVVAWSIFGALAGAAAGFGVDRLISSKYGKNNDGSRYPYSFRSK